MHFARRAETAVCAWACGQSAAVIRPIIRLVHVTGPINSHSLAGIEDFDVRFDVRV